jgi:two-component system chemotaxis response regulator CheY
MPKQILIIDDSKSMREVISFTLHSRGYEVVEAVDGEEGLTKAQTQTIQLILTDQNMPKMDGLTMIRSLRNLPDYKKVPILLLTTESDKALKKLGKEAGATGWLVKPFNPEKLLRTVQKLIG